MPTQNVRGVTAGLAAGAVAALIAVAVSLPLHAPNDTMFNSATVAIAAFATGLIGGLVWEITQSRQRWLVTLAILFGAAVMLALGIQTQLERALSFMVPLAAIMVGVVGVLTPLLARRVLPKHAAVLVGVAALVGGGLIGQGDAESGKLELPTVTTLAGVSTTSTPPADLATRVQGKTFAVVPAESTATYTIREQFANTSLPNNAVGSTSGLSGEITLDGRPSTLSLDVTSFRSDQSRRDQAVKRIFADDPTVNLVVESFGGLPADYQDGTDVERQLTAQTTIKGVTRPLIWDVVARLEGNTFSVTGKTDFRFEDFQMDPPNVAGSITVDQAIHIEVLLITRS